MEFWIDPEFDPTKDFEVIEKYREFPASSSLIQLILSLIIRWQMHYFVSDRAISSLLGIFKFFIHGIEKLFGVNQNHKLNETFPSTLYTTRKLCRIERNDFKNYIVCPECETLYNYDNSWARLFKSVLT